jgi:hypothetical protein
MAGRECPLEAAPLPAEVRESLAELELELSEGERRAALRDPSRDCRSGTPTKGRHSGNLPGTLAHGPPPHPGAPLREPAGDPLHPGTPTREPALNSHLKTAT